MRMAITPEQNPVSLPHARSHVIGINTEGKSIGAYQMLPAWEMGLLRSLPVEVLATLCTRPHLARFFFP